MDYLFIKLWYWALAAMAGGFLVGWFSCGRDDVDER